jgi:GntR family transcriptional repressor for pyruvate dehydrogenase complex
MSQVMEEIETQAVSDAISEQILKLISSGALKPGDSLPPQRKLAAQLGVSLSSLRESLHALAAVGVLDIKHGRGTFVSSGPTAPLAKQLDWALLLRGDETRELMEARRVLDVSVARMAAEHATSQQIDALRTLFDEMVDCWKARDITCLADRDVRFHLSLATAAGNSLLLRLTESLYSVVEQFIRVVPHTSVGLENHGRVLEAITSRQPDEAEAAMRTLLDQTEQLYQEQNSLETPGAP